MAGFARDLRAHAASVADAVAAAEVVLVAVPGPAVTDVLQAAGPLDGRVMIDAANSFGQQQVTLRSLAGSQAPTLRPDHRKTPEIRRRVGTAPPTLPADSGRLISVSFLCNSALRSTSYVRCSPTSSKINSHYRSNAVTRARAPVD